MIFSNCKLLLLHEPEVDKGVNMKQASFIFICCTLIFFLTSCATMINGSKQTVTLMSEPAGATVTVKLFMAVNGIERKVYEQAFAPGADPDGLWVVNGTLAIHEPLRVEIASDNAADNGQAIDYDYMLEAM